MIEIRYYKDENRVTVHGHAGSAEKGRDLICAACSTLAITLAENVRQMEEAGIANEMTIELEEGHADIRCVPSKMGEETVRRAFESVCVGFEILAKKYPAYIFFTVQGCYFPARAGIMGVSQTNGIRRPGKSGRNGLE